MSLVISLKNLEYNINSMKSYIGDEVFLCPMVKANAYGHGDVPTCQILLKHNITNLGVATIEEGIRLRKCLDTNVNILVFGSNYDVQAVVKYRLTPVICQMFDLKNFSDHKIDVHIKFDTGMSRFGFEVKDAPMVRDFLSKSKLQLKGLATHLASSFDIYDPDGYTNKQLSKFNQIRSYWPEGIPSHCHNSASLLNRNCGDQVGARPGLCIYGVYPPKTRENNFKLKPVMSLTSQVLHTKMLSKNTSVSYSQSYTMDVESRVAVVGLGYSNGIMRQASNRLKVLINGEKFSQIGFITMNSMMIKINDSVSVGDKVTILGSDNDNTITASDIADWARTIPNEVLTNLGNGKINI